jgi:2OG-Fe(II) oxygenase superfamily
MNNAFTWDAIETPAPGIRIYKNVVKKELDIITRIEDILSEDEEQRWSWKPALVGYSEKMPEYRDCVDFKYKKADLLPDPSPESLALQQIWQDVYDVQVPAVDEYRGQNNMMPLRYWESFNFIRYTKGQHFQEHHDHGYSYNCVTSLVTYLNDDYEGGELYFRTWGLTLKPDAGDVVMFPSNYMYPHRAMPVLSGTKYAIVTMLDYSAKYHTLEMYQETGD